MKCKLFKAWLIAAFSVMAATAQAGWFGKSGENASYSIWAIVPRSLEEMRIRLPGQSKGFLAGSARFDYMGYVFDRPPPIWAGYQRMADTGHRIPEEVDVSWREIPPPGADPYTGELQGPYRIQVRSRIPPEVLEQAAKDGFSIEMLFSVGKLPILFNWRLVEFRSVTGSGRGLQVLRQGGDSYQ